MSHILVAAQGAVEYLRTRVNGLEIGRAAVRSAVFVMAGAIVLGGSASADAAPRPEGAVSARARSRPDRAPVPPPRLRQPPSAGFDSGADRPGQLGLQRRDDGSYSYVDPAQQFTLTILPDGRVQFADRWRRTSSEDRQRGKCCGRPPQGVMAALNPFAGIAMAGPLEWMLRRRDHDLATADKVAILRRTEAFRTKLAVAWNRANLANRLRALPTDLRALWNDTSIPVTRRREILFEHWDACEDRLGAQTDGIPPAAVVIVDQERLTTARKARAAILRFVAKNLGHGAPQAFTAGELKRFNARRVSLDPFAPYAGAAK